MIETFLLFGCTWLSILLFSKFILSSFPEKGSTDSIDRWVYLTSSILFAAQVVNLVTRSPRYTPIDTVRICQDPYLKESPSLSNTGTFELTLCSSEKPVYIEKFNLLSIHYVGTTGRATLNKLQCRFEDFSVIEAIYWSCRFQDPKYQIIFH